MNMHINSTRMRATARSAATKAHHADDLSFMARKEPRGTGIDYWIVEGTGSYTIDCEKGAELAREYLAYVGQRPSFGNATLLTVIVGGMMERCRDEGRLTGIEIGFLNQVSLHVTAAMAALKGGAA